MLDWVAPQETPPFLHAITYLGGSTPLAVNYRRFPKRALTQPFCSQLAY